MAAAVLLGMALSACHGARSILLTEQEEFTLAQEYMKARKWEKAREHFQRLSDRYPGSAMASEAILGKAESYFLAEDYAEARTEYQLFLEFYPSHEKADVALYRVGIAQSEDMRSIDRDQTPTVEAITTFQQFLTRFPKSELVAEVTVRLGEAQDRLKRHDLYVARFYQRRNLYVGAAARYRKVLQTYPLADQERAEVQGRFDEVWGKFQDRRLRYVQDDFAGERWFSVVESVNLLRHHKPEQNFDDKTLHAFGESLYQLKRYQEAKAVFQMLTELHSTSSHMEHARGRLVELESLADAERTPSTEIQGDIEP